MCALSTTVKCTFVAMPRAKFYTPSTNTTIGDVSEPLKDRGPKRKHNAKPKRFAVEHASAGFVTSNSVNRNQLNISDAGNTSVVTVCTAKVGESSFVVLNVRNVIDAY